MSALTSVRPARSCETTPPRSHTAMSPMPAASSMLAIAMPAAPAPEITTRRSDERSPGDPRGVGERCCRDHRRAVLVVVEHRDVEALLQPTLDLEAARRADVLEVDAAVRRGDARHGVDDLVDVGRVEADRHAVDAAELLEQQRLALHHGERGERPDVAETEHGGAVGDDEDGVAAPGVAPRRATGRRRSPARRGRRRACTRARGPRCRARARWGAPRSCRGGGAGRRGRRRTAWCR